MHARAMHILAKNPEMGKGQAFAIATQQAHATGHTPKSYGTSVGRREAKAKYDEPKKSYDQTSDPGSVGKKLERAEDRGRVKIKQAGLGSLVSSVVVPEQHQQVQELRQEIEQLKAALPKKYTKIKLHKQASLMLTSPFDAAMIGGFSDELQKLAGVVSDKVESWAANKIRKSPTIQDALAEATEKGLKSRMRNRLLVHAAPGVALGVASLGAGAYSYHKLRQLKNRFHDLEKRVGTHKEESSEPSPMPKTAAGAETEGNPVGLSQIKSTIPTKPLSGKTPKYSKVNSDPSPSPLAGQQPISDPPPVRA